VCCYGSIGFALPFSAFALLCCAFIRTTIQLSVRPPRQAATLSTKKTESSAAPAPIHVSPTYLLATCTVAAPPLAGVKACLHKSTRELASHPGPDRRRRTHHDHLVRLPAASCCRRRGHRTRAQAPPHPPPRTCRAWMTHHVTSPRGRPWPCAAGRRPKKERTFPRPWGEAATHVLRQKKKKKSSGGGGCCW
jgi:hypothetical protein